MNEHEKTIVGPCEQAVQRLHDAFRTREVSFLLRVGDVLRSVAHVGRLRLIYEIPRDWGGVLWRAAEQGTPQLVKDVTRDPDYLSQDESIRAEIAVPVKVDEKVVGVLNVESQEGLDEQDVQTVEQEAERLARELAAAR